MFGLAVADWPGPLVEWPKRAKEDRDLTVQRLNGWGGNGQESNGLGPKSPRAQVVSINGKARS